MQFACPHCQKLLSIDAQFAGQMTTCPLCQASIQIPTVARPQPVSELDSSIGGLIPTKNKAALIGYYLSVFSLIPILGLPLGIAAIVLGAKGLKKVKKTPEARGTAHAWVALILGSVTSLGYSALLVLIISAAFLD